MLDRQYERYRRIKSGEIVVDIGAGIGDFAVLAEKSAALVCAFEKDSFRASTLACNAALNQCSSLKHYAMEVASIDSIIEEIPQGKIDFLKVDCEGAEYPIFSATSNQTLERISYISMEVHTNTLEMSMELEKLLKRLSNSGFKLKVEGNPVHSYLKMLYAERLSQFK